MNTFDKKRARSQNWDDIEKNIFIECMKEELHIIENKKRLTVLNKDKMVAWDRVGKRMEVEGYTRDIKRMKEQWQRMKVQAKKNISSYRRSCNATGGGPPPTEPAEIDWKLKDLIPQEFFEDTSVFDSDSTNTTPLQHPDAAATNANTPSKRRRTLDEFIHSEVDPVTSDKSYNTCPALDPQPSSSQEEEEEEIHIFINQDDDGYKKKRCRHPNSQEAKEGGKDVYI